MEKFMSLFFLAITFIIGLPVIMLTVRVMLSPAFDRFVGVLADVATIIVWGGAVSVVAMMIGGAVFVLGRAMAATWDKLVDARHIWPDANGQFPIVKMDKAYADLTPESVRLMASMVATMGAFGQKPTAATIGRFMQEAIPRAMADIEMPPLLDDEEQMDDGFDIGRVDPVTAPHWLFIGQTGSGKSTAMFTVLRQLRERYGAEFVICEPGGVDWNDQADFISYDDIAGAIEAEYEVMKERQAALREADVNHVSRMPDPLPYRYMVLEETDSLLDNLSRDRAKDAIFHLREIARMGRKTGIGLIALSQTALADVFNTHVRGNLSNVYLFRGSQQIARIWGVSKLVDLQALQPGQAFDVSYERVVQFPMAERPVLSELRRGAGAVRDGAGRVRSGASTGKNGVSTASTGRNGSAPVVLAPVLPPGRRPGHREAAMMRAWYHDGVSKTEIARRIWGYKSSDVWPWVIDAIEGRL